MHAAGPAAQIEPVRVAVVGLGYWGPNLARVLHELPQAALAGICDVRPDAVERVTARYPVVRVAAYEELLEDPEVEAIAIATPVSSHWKLARAALEAGKHVFIEKPLADSEANCADLIEEGRRRGLVVMPGHTFLYSPSVLMIGDLIQAGELGEIYFISSSRVNLGLHRPDVSVTWDLGPHDFSILRHWLGEAPSEVFATSRCCVIEGVADVAFITLTFPSGTIAHVELSWLAPSKLRRTAIVGSKKMVVYDDTSAEPVRVFDSGVVPRPPQSFGEFQLAYRSGDVLSPKVGAAEPLAEQMADFCDAVRFGIEPRSNAQVGLDVVRICELVDRSLELGQPVVALSIESRA